MDTNTLVGLVIAFTGVLDLLVVGVLGARLPAASRMAIGAFGVLFVLLGGAVSLGLVRIV